MPETWMQRAGVCALAAVVSVAAGLMLARHHGVPSAGPPPVGAGAAPLSLAEFHAAVNDGRTLVLDTRDDLLFERGHVPGALSLPARRFDAAYAHLKSRFAAEPARRIVLYCSGVQCPASHQVRERLWARGHPNVAIFPDGWSAWRAAGYSEEKSDPATVALAPWDSSR